MPEQLFAQPEDILKTPAVTYLTVGKINYVSYTPPQQPSHNYLQAAAGIAAAFLAFRWMMTVGLNEENVRKREDIDKSLQKLQDIVLPEFTVLAEPHIHLAASLVNNKIEDNYAKVYSDELGKYISDTSSQAVLDGYMAAVNAGIERMRAWEIAASGYGLDQTQMRQYVTASISEHNAIKPGYDTRNKTKPSEILLQKLIDSRAEKIGSNESFAAAQMSTIVSFQSSQYRGELQNGIRRWETAQDERVCPTCGPLDGVEADMFEPFSVNGKQIWAPGIHPNCRCSVSIMYPAQVISKAGWTYNEATAEEDPFDRDSNGRFSRVESRTKKATVLDRKAAQKVIEELKQVKSPFAPVETSPFVSGQIKQTTASAFSPAKTAFAPTATETSVFAPAQQSVFVPTETSAFVGTSAFTPIKQELAIVVINGIKMKRMAKTEPVKVDTDYADDGEPNEPDTDPYYIGDPLYMFGTHIENEYEKQEGDGLRVGSIVDFDQLNPLDQDPDTGERMHVGFTYTGNGMINPRALAFSAGSAQEFMSYQKEVGESPDMAGFNSSMTETAYEYIDNEVEYSDVSDLVDAYATNNNQCIHIYQNYLKELKGSSMDTLTYEQFSRLSLHEKQEALIDTSLKSYEDDYAIKMAFSYLVAGNTPEVLRSEMGMYKEGSSMSGKNLDVLFKFDGGYEGYRLETDMGLDAGQVTGQYEVTNIELENDLPETDIEDATLYMNGNQHLIPNEWRLITLRPIINYNFSGYPEAE